MSEYSQEYKNYMASPQWRERRLQAIAKAKGRCQRCGISMGHAVLQVHHINYDRLGCEADSDLLVVCIPCHKKEDALRRSRTKYEQHESKFNRRMIAWAEKVYGEDWDYIDQDEAEDRFREFLERIGEL